MKEFVIKTQLSVKYAQHSTGRVYSANAMPARHLLTENVLEGEARRSSPCASHVMPGDE